MNAYLFFYFHAVPPPIITINPSNIIVNVFKPITFVCVAVGHGNLLFVWEHDDSVISASNSTLQQNSLTNDSVLPQHQGQYKCTVTSSYSTLSSYGLATLRLNGNFMHTVQQGIFGRRKLLKFSYEHTILEMKSRKRHWGGV